MNFNEVIGFCAWTISNSFSLSSQLQIDPRNNYKKKKKKNKKKKLQDK